MMLPSVYMPHGGREEMDDIEALESVKITSREGKAWRPWTSLSAAT